MRGAYRLLQRKAPRLYVRLIARRGADFYPVTQDCALVIAGAPGSANSYVRAAFLQANPGVPVASHAHVWTEVEDGVRWGRPVLLLVREPLGEAASRLTRFGNVTPAQALSDYAEYHEHALAWKGDVVVARFEEATAAVGTVIGRINARFGTTFTPFPDGEPEAVATLKALLSPANGALPQAERQAERDAARAALSAPALSALRRRCDAAYSALVDP